MPRILVVDDENYIAELIRFNLAKEGWDVETSFDGRNALERVIEIKPDLVVLDIMLPELDGLEVCRYLKAHQETAGIPIIMLSAKSEELDRILGLEIGADDYMIKPFSPRELIARIKARLRRKVRDQESPAILQVEELKVGSITMNAEKFEVFVNSVKQDLTLKEFELLKLLISNKGKVFTRDYLLERIWGYEYSLDTRTIDVHVRHLRQKIEEDPSHPKNIVTVRGVGYKFRDIS